MAYINFSELPAAAPAADLAPAAKGATSAFSAVEWLVISLAQKDSLNSLGEPGPLTRAMRGLFGLGAQSRLADPRLERLRRLAVLAWHHGWRLPTSEIKAFLTEFSAAQLEALVAAIAHAKPQGRRRPA